MPEITWDETVGEWVCQLPDDTVIWSANKETLEALLDLIDEQKERQRENWSIVGAIVLGSILMGVAAIVAALWGG
jgi:hypothetical protein